MDRIVDSAAPVVWWWDEDEGRRCVLLTSRVLALTGPLDADQVAALDVACRAGDPLAADLGRHPGRIVLDAVSALSLRPGPTRLVVELADGVTSWTISPTPGASPVAVTIFDELRRRLAPDNPVRATDVARPAPPPPATRTGPVMLAVLFTVVGVIAAAAWRLASAGAQIGGPAGWLGQIVNDLFVSVGPLPALGALAVAAGAFARWRLHTPPPPPVRVIGPEIRVLVGQDREPAPEEREIPPDALVFTVDADGEDPLAALLRP